MKKKAIAVYEDDFHTILMFKVSRYAKTQKRYTMADALHEMLK